MKTSRSTVLGCAAAGALVVASMMAIVQPAPGLRAVLALLAPVVASLAFLGSWRDGRCPRCRARHSEQSRTELAASAAVASRAGQDGDAVSIDLGWDVTLGEISSCGRCKHQYTSQDTVYVSRTRARSASEALVLARQDNPLS